MNLDLKSKRWSFLKKNTDRAMAINPFTKNLHYCRGCACQELGESQEAIESFEKLLYLGATNPSEVRFRLAKLHRETNPDRAKKYLVDCLAESPRYREALALLLEMGNTAND
ncbi:MAG: tetratricopeptide repeat protein, partial [Verrucomicrobiota bacterium]